MDEESAGRQGGSGDAPPAQPVPPATPSPGSSPDATPPPATPPEPVAPPPGSPPPPAAPPAPPPTPSAATPPPPAPERGLIERIPGYVVPLLLIGIPLLAAGIAVAVPDFYDHVIWQYYWGPIHADAAGYTAECLLPDGRIVPFGCTGEGVEARSGYNVVNTASWAVLLGLCIVGTGQLLRRFRATMDARLIVAATLWVVAGSVWHVLEDGELFGAPLKYFFITPIIYLVFAALGVLSFALGQYLRAAAELRNVTFALHKLWMILAIPVLGYLFLYLEQWDQVHVWVNPIWVAVYTLVAFAAAAWRFQRIGRIDPTELVAFLSIGWLLLSLHYVGLFEMQPFPDYRGQPDPIREALWAPVLAAALVAIIWFLARGQRRKHPVGAAAFLLPINLLLLFSQMLDAFATSIGIDIGGYTEKHVLSKNLIDWTRDLGDATGIAPLSQYPTFLGFAPVKLAVSLLVVYAIDISNPKEAERHPTMIGLVKFAIIMVGMGPGVRDFVRMALGI